MRSGISLSQFTCPMNITAPQNQPPTPLLHPLQVLVCSHGHQPGLQRPWSAAVGADEHLQRLLWPDAGSCVSITRSARSVLEKQGCRLSPVACHRAGLQKRELRPEGRRLM